MERVAFLLEKTGERFGCLLNPESVVVRRLAGVRSRQSSSGPLTGVALKDDPLIYTGGGMTEILLDLLFDVSLAGSTTTTEDVRDLTGRLTELAEGRPGDDEYGEVPLVRFVWGKSWNVLGVVTAVAERLEHFNSSGAPQRSWLRMRFLRVSEPSAVGFRDQKQNFSVPQLPDKFDVSPDQLRYHELKGSGEKESGSGTERLDEIAFQQYGNADYWRVIAAFNNIDNPWQISAGKMMLVPPSSVIKTTT